MQKKQETVKLKSQKLYDKQYEFAKMIDNYNGKYHFLILGRNQGKTTLLKNLIIKDAVTNNNRIIYLITQTQTFTKKILEQIHQILKPLVINYNKGELIRLSNGTTIEGMSYNDYDNLRGNNFAQSIYIDEAAKLPDKGQDSVLSQMCFTAQKVFLISTPRGKNQFYKLYHLQEDNKLALHGTSYDNPHIPSEEKAKLRKLEGTNIYKQEILAEFVLDGGEVFNNVGMLKEVVPMPKNSRAYFTGIDLAKEHDYTVLTTMDENHVIVDIERFNKTPTYTDIVKRIQLHQAKQKSHLIIEANNFGAIIIEELHKLGVHSIFNFLTTHYTKQDIITHLRYKLAECKITTAIPAYTLVEELEAFDYKITKNSQIQYSAPEGLHDDCVMSLAMVAQYVDNKYKGAIKKVKLI